MQKLYLTCLLLFTTLWLSSCSIRSVEEPASPRLKNQPFEQSTPDQPVFLAFEIYVPKTVRNVRALYECEGEPLTFNLTETDFNQNEDQLTLLLINKCAPKNVERLKLIIEYSDSSIGEVTAN